MAAIRDLSDGPEAGFSADASAVAGAAAAGAAACCGVVSACATTVGWSAACRVPLVPAMLDESSHLVFTADDEAFASGGAADADGSVAAAPA